MLYTDTIFKACKKFHKKNIFLIKMQRLFLPVPSKMDSVYWRFFMNLLFYIVIVKFNTYGISFLNFLIPSFFWKGFKKNQNLFNKKSNEFPNQKKKKIKGHSFLGWGKNFTASYMIKGKSYCFELKSPCQE